MLLFSRHCLKPSNFSFSVADIRDEFRTVPTDTDALGGTDATLTCAPPRGHPAPIVKWRKNGLNLDLASGSRLRIEPSGDLVIYDVAKVDEGNYECVAENAAGKRTSTPVRLRVNGKEDREPICRRVRFPDLARKNN